jgi:hypothetical protein
MDPVEKAVAITLDNWESLGVQEHEGVLHLPASIKRRNSKGIVEEQPVALRNVTNAHRYKCRQLARSHAVEHGLDIDRDKDVVSEIENWAILTYAIREPEKPFDQHVATVKDLTTTYDTQSLVELWGRYNIWVDMLDPRFGEMSNEQIWLAIARIHAEKNPSFLASFGGTAQITIITCMADLCMSSPTRPSWLQS